MEHGLGNQTQPSSEKQIKQSQPADQSQAKTRLPAPVGLIVGFVAGLVLGGVGGYILGFQAKVSGILQPTEPIAQPQPTLEPDTPVDISGEGTFEILDGSLYRVLSSGETELLIDKQETGVIFDFREVASPDKTKRFLMVQGGISLDYLYYLPTMNTAKRIGTTQAQEAAWSNNSRFIAYASKPADAGPLIDVYLYDTQTNENTEISDNHDITDSDYSYLGFRNLRWLDDDSGVLVDYAAYTGELPNGETLRDGETILWVNQG